LWRVYYEERVKRTKTPSREHLYDRWDRHDNKMMRNHSSKQTKGAANNIPSSGFRIQSHWSWISTCKIIVRSKVLHSATSSFFHTNNIRRHFQVSPPLPQRKSNIYLIVAHWFASQIKQSVKPTTIKAWPKPWTNWNFHCWSRPQLTSCSDLLDKCSLVHIYTIRN